ncbi:uncharacterized protein LOC143465899 [Clavelina lepadiformis]|uniref:uncharacterized protein LOC143465899 n=1 Tax=Clavelina lepadiformis TaxID=159417 RepID=UPI0040414B2B
MKPQMFMNNARTKNKGRILDARGILRKRRANVPPGKSNVTRTNVKFSHLEKIIKTKQFIHKEDNTAITRTITNRTKSKSPAPASSVSGFVSFKDGQRVLMDKVTMDSSGIKIAIRNEFVRDTEPRQKEERKRIKVTLDNPSATKKHHKKPSFRQQLSAKRNLYLKKSVPPTQTRRRSPLPSEESMSATKPQVGQVTPESSVVYRNPSVDPCAKLEFGLRPMQSSNDSSKYRLAREKESEAMEYSSPLEGHKIIVSNLHPVVIEDDILELFSVLGPVRRARLVEPGKAEVVYVRRTDAIRAYQKYNCRDLDGQPMQMKLAFKDISEQKSLQYRWMTEVRHNQNLTEAIDIDPNILQRALFKGGSTGTSAHPVVFTVKI